MKPYNIHQDFKQFERISIPLYPAVLPLMNSLMKFGFDRSKTAMGVRSVKRMIPGYRNETIELTIFEPEGIGHNTPCLIYLHGGAFALQAAPHHKSLACAYASQTPCKVVFVDYRLAPRFPFPVGVEDCYAACAWVGSNADAVGIDKNKVAIGGDSAGGALAAAVALMSRDRKGPQLCFQMLIYPVTDERQTTGSMKAFIDTPLWNARLNEKMWKLYLKDGVTVNKEYASPMEASSLAALPAAYVEVSEFDCLRDEGICYAQELERSGIHVDLNRTTGTIHGFEVAENSDIVRQSIAQRVASLQKAFTR